eukprot:914312-Rhodomonas_salina.2
MASTWTRREVGWDGLDEIVSGRAPIFTCRAIVRRTCFPDNLGALQPSSAGAEHGSNLRESVGSWLFLPYNCVILV